MMRTIMQCEVCHAQVDAIPVIPTGWVRLQANSVKRDYCSITCMTLDQDSLTLAVANYRPTMHEQLDNLVHRVRNLVRR